MVAARAAGSSAGSHAARIGNDSSSPTPQSSWQYKYPRSPSLNSIRPRSVEIKPAPLSRRCHRKIGLDLGHGGIECLFERCVVAPGVVMEWHQMLDTGQLAEGEGIVHRAMSPAGVSGIFVAGVLRVVQEQIDVLRELEAGSPFRVDGKAAGPKRGLVIGKIGERACFRLDPVAYRRARVADARGPDLKWPDREATTTRVVQLESARKIPQQHRK